MQNPKLFQIALLSHDQALATALENLLESHLRVKHFPNLKAFREHETVRHFNAVFCDWCLCSAAWREALKAVREDCPDLPVIILSRSAGERDWVAVIEAGAFDLLVPPYSKEAVLAVLEQARASRQARHRHLMELQGEKEAS